jgi:hypothetical protein
VPVRLLPIWVEANFGVQAVRGTNPMARKGDPDPFTIGKGVPPDRLFFASDSAGPPTRSAFERDAFERDRSKINEATAYSTTCPLP